MTVLGESNFGGTISWIFTKEEDGTFKVVKDSSGALTTLHTGSDEIAARAFWRTLNDNLCSPSYTP
jgi:hypothetical protein